MTDLGSLDVMVKPEGCPLHERLRRRAQRLEIAVGGPRDLADIAELEAIQRLRR